MNWFQRHLNWTYMLANLALSLVVMVERELLIVGLAMYPIAGWVIIQKGRSLWWILLTPIYSPLWLKNKETEPLTSVASSRGDRPSSQEPVNVSTATRNRLRYDLLAIAVFLFYELAIIIVGIVRCGFR